MFSNLVLFTSLLLFFGWGSSAREIRCYCNTPECSENNNICRVDEDKGACYSDFFDYRDITRARQGCLHLLPTSRQDLCGNAPGSTGAPRSLLLCCQVDMCNQRTHSIIESFINATERQTTGVEEGNSRVPPFSYSNHEVWFKAATIAVPICGAMILLMLVALACRILRSDNVTVDKFCHDASNAASELNQYSLTHTQDAAKKVPLLYDARHNCEDFRSFTSTRIHYGQNVNVLKEMSSKAEKNVNVEYARINEERNVVVVVEAEDVENSNDDFADVAEAHETLDVRVETPVRPVPAPSFNLNLDKSENVDSCNIYKSPRQSEVSTVTDKCNKYCE